MEIAIETFQCFTGGLTHCALERYPYLPGLFKEDFFDVYHIRWDSIVMLGIGTALSADEEHRECDIRQSENHLMYPAGYTAAHIRPSTFKQQADIGNWFLRDLDDRFLAENHSQNLANSANGGRRRIASGKCASNCATLA